MVAGLNGERQKQSVGLFLVARDICFLFVFERIVKYDKLFSVLVRNLRTEDYGSQECLEVDQSSADTRIRSRVRVRVPVRSLYFACVQICLRVGGHENEFVRVRFCVRVWFARVRIPDLCNMDNFAIITKMWFFISIYNQYQKRSQK